VTVHSYTIFPFNQAPRPTQPADSAWPRLRVLLMVTTTSREETTSIAIGPVTRTFGIKVLAVDNGPTLWYASLTGLNLHLLKVPQMRLNNMAADHPNSLLP